MAANAIIGGQVTMAEGPAKGPLVIGILAQGEDQQLNLIDHFVAEKAGTWIMSVEPGTYQVAAFEDSNSNGRYDDEPATFWNDRGIVELTAGEIRNDVDLSILGGGRFLTRDFSLEKLQTRGREEQQTISFYALSAVGQQATLSDPRFAREVASSGMWKPYDFVLAGYAGIYFLEPYDAKRVPVLFVHGMGGTPIEFREMISALDHSRFQAWVAYYPSGMSLDVLGVWMTQLFSRLHAKYRFDEAAVVAHSMGGLVTRDFILNYEKSSGSKAIRTYVTISSPLGGLESARSGVEDSPIVVLSWRGLAPHSKFLDGLFYSDFPENQVRRRLPDRIAYHLLFGYHGGGRSGSSDGTVVLSSQLRPEAQEEARSIRGFDETHVGILESPAVAARLNEVLLQHSPPAP